MYLYGRKSLYPAAKYQTGERNANLQLEFPEVFNFEYDSGH